MITARLRCAVKSESGSTRDGSWRTHVRLVPDYGLVAEPSVLLELTVRGDLADEFEPGRRYVLQLVPVDDS